VTAVPASRRGGAMAAQMVAAPATRGADVEFNTDVFRKDKIILAGRDEVC
jgi:ketol-acid reductoisomerase